MRAVLISVSMVPRQQCAADASPNIWDHTVLPATRYRQTRPCLIYGRRARPSHITAVTHPAVKPVPVCTAWWTEARVWTTCPRSLPGSALARSRTCDLRVTSSARYHYTKSHYIQRWFTCLPIVIYTNSNHLIASQLRVTSFWSNALQILTVMPLRLFNIYNYLSV